MYAYQQSSTIYYIYMYKCKHILVYAVMQGSEVVKKIKQKCDIASRQLFYYFILPQLPHFYSIQSFFALPCAHSHTNTRFLFSIICSNNISLVLSAHILLLVILHLLPFNCAPWMLLAIIHERNLQNLNTDAKYKTILYSYIIALGNIGSSSNFWCES